MEKLFKLLSLQNQFFAPDDSLTEFITETLAAVEGEGEIEEEYLEFVQAARGPSAFPHPDEKKETKN